MTERKIKPEEEVEFQFKWVVPDFGLENPGLLIIVKTPKTLTNTADR